MKYLSIDIETGGIDRACSLLKVHAKADDLNDQKPLEELPSFTYLLHHDIMILEPRGAVMNAKLIQDISEGKGKPEDEFAEEFEDWIDSLKWEQEVVNVAGKNFQAFDIDWLGDVRHRFNYRSLDPGTSFLRKGDERVPGLKKCLERIGVTDMELHVCENDVDAVILLTRRIWNASESEEAGRTGTD